MGRLVANVMVSLDGVVLAAGEAGAGPGDGWQRYWTAGVPELMAERLSEAEALLQGRGTHVWLRDVADPADPVTTSLLGLPRFVVSRGPATGSDATWIRGDVATRVRRLKAGRRGDVVVHGSPVLLRTLMACELVDEFALWVFPVILGTGRRLFGGVLAPVGLDLIEATTLLSGVVLMRYVLTGAPEEDVLPPYLAEAGAAGGNGRPGPAIS